MKTAEYKGYKIKTDINGDSYIYRNNILKGCTHSDDNKNNSEKKAKKRIDNNKVNMLNN